MDGGMASHLPSTDPIKERPALLGAGFCFLAGERVQILTHLEGFISASLCMSDQRDAMRTQTVERLGVGFQGCSNNVQVPEHSGGEEIEAGAMFEPLRPGLFPNPRRPNPRHY